MSELEEKLRERLTNFTYQSRSGFGKRQLMEHHIEALVKDLVPFIGDYLEDQLSKTEKPSDKF